MPSRAELARISLLFGLGCVLWLAVALLCGRTLATGLLPLLRWEIAQLAPKYEITDLGVARSGGETAIVLRAETAHSRSYGGRTLPARAALSSSTLLGHLLQPLVVMFSLISTAALLQPRYALRFFLLAVPAAVAVLMVDVPFVLVGALEDLVLANVASSQVSPSPWVIWMNFLNGGGRLAIGLGAALLVIGLVPKLALLRDRRMVSQNRPRVNSPLAPLSQRGDGGSW